MIAVSAKDMHSRGHEPLVCDAVVLVTLRRLLLIFQAIVCQGGWDKTCPTHRLGDYKKLLKLESETLAQQPSNSDF